jgi:hypothetical protein
MVIVPLKDWKFATFIPPLLFIYFMINLRVVLQIKKATYIGSFYVLSLVIVVISVVKFVVSVVVIIIVVIVVIVVV